MATIYLDPNADIVAGWGPGLNNYSYIDDAVRQPGDPGTATEIESNSDAVDEYNFPTDTVGTVSSIKVWVYAVNPGTATADIYVNGAYTGTPVDFSIAGEGWYSVEFTAGYDQADIDALQVKLTQVSGGTNRTTVYELYVEVTYTAASSGTGDLIGNVF